MIPTIKNSFTTRLDDIHDATRDARDNAVRLMNEFQDIWETRKIHHQIATSESLTAGLIMSTLVDVPFGGWYKYGGFMVYDTDAKRVFNGVVVEDVYTEECAEQMAIGVLKNSNCSIALSVTGNAKPPPGKEENLGVVYICVAGYTSDHEIICSTKVITGCEMRDSIIQKCNTWKDHSRQGWNPPPKDYPLTFEMSMLLRTVTTIEALQYCTEFMKQNRDILMTPSFILEESSTSRRGPQLDKFNNKVVVRKIQVLKKSFPRSRSSNPSRRLRSSYPSTRSTYQIDLSPDTSSTTNSRILDHRTIKRMSLHALRNPRSIEKKTLKNKSRTSIRPVKQKLTLSSIPEDLPQHSHESGLTLLPRGTLLGPR